MRLLHFAAAQHRSLLTLKRQARIRRVGPQDQQLCKVRSNMADMPDTRCGAHRQQLTSAGSGGPGRPATFGVFPEPLLHPHKDE